ncbi:MAG: hypothetical protein RLY86_3253 [Pseudomonadota bacterium]|jgi:predicted AAA+ superfamily ATPase
MKANRSMYPRHTRIRIAEALSDTRVVLITGPRQSGKTTLLRALCDDGRPYLTLDDATTLATARADPVGFVRALDTVAIDEVQRAPGLLLAIKESVDRDPRPGRFLLTGSANLMTVPAVADSLAGRMEAIPLLPLAQAEIRGRPGNFLQAVFAPTGHLSLPIEPGVTGADLVATVLAGGYPEAVRRSSWSRREAWYLAYVDALVQRDVQDVATIDQLDRMPRLLRALAQQAGQLVNHSATGAALGLNHVTTQRYTSVFTQLWLLHLLPSWHSNALSRLIKTPKLHFLDSGLLAALRGLSPERVASDRTGFGPVLESFVVSELMKQVAWSGSGITLSHFRDKDGAEVDVVLEDRLGRLVGIEVKAAATVTRSDLKGLQRLAQAAGDRFVQGIVLYDHDRPVPLGDRLTALPVTALFA